jgi:glycosyltransferase involved in cell wall biosynthesis
VVAAGERRRPHAGGNHPAAWRGRGHRVETITPDGFATVPCPGYGEIRLAVGCGRAVARRMDAFAPEAIHIATEGPLGWAARRWCMARELPFTTSFHTRFPDYLALRTGLPADWVWPLVRRFHAPAARTFVATATLADELAARGLRNLHRWSRGVDLTAFSPDTPPLAAIKRLPGPILLYVGRVAVEKNIEAFLRAAVPAPRSSSATDRHARRWRVRSLTRISWAPCTARRSPRPMPPPTCSSFRAGPIRSDW